MDTVRTHIINAFHLDGMPEEKQNEMISQIGELVFQGVMLQALQSMTEDKQNEIEKMLDKDLDPEALFAYLEKEVPNLQEIIEREVAEFKAQSDLVMGAN